jgi:hypothetical protein
MDNRRNLNTSNAANSSREDALNTATRQRLADMQLELDAANAKKKD